MHRIKYVFNGEEIFSTNANREYKSSVSTEKLLDKEESDGNSYSSLL